MLTGKIVNVSRSDSGSITALVALASAIVSNANSSDGAGKPWRCKVGNSGRFSR